MVQTLARGGVCLTLSGCMTLVPQLEPTDFASVEQVSARRERDQLRSDNTINRHYEPQGTRYTKGSDPAAPRRSWQGRRRGEGWPSAADLQQVLQGLGGLIEEILMAEAENDRLFLEMARGAL